MISAFFKQENESYKEEKKRRKNSISICGLEQQEQSWGKSSVPETLGKGGHQQSPTALWGRRGLTGSTDPHPLTSLPVVRLGDIVLPWSLTRHKLHQRCLSDNHKALSRVTLGPDCILILLPSSTEYPLLKK